MVASKLIIQDSRKTLRFLLHDFIDFFVRPMILHNSNVQNSNYKNPNSLPYTTNNETDIENECSVYLTRSRSIIFCCSNTQFDDFICNAGYISRVGPMFGALSTCTVVNRSDLGYFKKMSSIQNVINIFYCSFFTYNYNFISTIIFHY